MAINFFQQQQDARRRTALLLLLFALAVVVLTVITALCLSGFLPVFFAGDTDHAVLVGALLAPAVILSASAYKLWWLSDGGHTIALNMGGVLLHTPKNHKEQQLLNIVEEMAIASGMSVPPVYILQDEPAINAFTAGYRPGDMVIGITQGALKMLTREELQGVVAHEFSHMYNGDTRLNTLMIGVLYGINMITLIGMKLENLSMWGEAALSIKYFRQEYSSGKIRTKSEENGTSGGILSILLLAWSLVIIGALGWFFAAMIKAAVCREREYLADAAAVQFTRNPNGIANALKKIGGYAEHSYLIFSGRAMFEHMLFSFADNPRYEFASHATHPPLVERIRRLDPAWDDEFPRFSAFDLALLADELEKPRYDAVKTAQILGIITAAPTFFSSTPLPEDLSHLAYARDVLMSIPEDWLACARSPDLSCCVLLALLLCKDTAIARTQLTRIAQDKRLWAEKTEQLMMSLPKVQIAQRLPLIEIALPRLGVHIDDIDAFARFKTLLQDTIRADQKVSVFEWCVYTIASSHLKQTLTPTPILPLNRTIKKAELLAAYRQLFSLSVRFCNHGQQPDAAYQAACESAEIPVGEGYDRTVRLADLPKTLRALNQLPPLEKPQLLHALAAIIRHDGALDSEEREFLHAVAITLDAPIPPLDTSSAPNQ